MQTSRKFIEFCACVDKSNDCLGYFQDNMEYYMSKCGFFTVNEIEQTQRDIEYLCNGENGFSFDDSLSVLKRLFAMRLFYISEVIYE